MVYSLLKLEDKVLDNIDNLKDFFSHFTDKNYESLELIYNEATGYNILNDEALIFESERY